MALGPSVGQAQDVAGPERLQWPGRKVFNSENSPPKLSTRQIQLMVQTLDSVVPSKITLQALIVDDEPSILETFSAILNMRDFQVHTASSAANAIQALQQNKFDLILTDLSMETST